jgi:hypothetical protein
MTRLSRLGEGFGRWGGEVVNLKGDKGGKMGGKRREL